MTENYYEVNTGDGSLNVFAPTTSGATQPLYRIVGRNSQGASGVALDSSGNAYLTTVLQS